MTAGDSPKPLTEVEKKRWAQYAAWGGPTSIYARGLADHARLSRLLADQQTELEAARAERDEARSVEEELDEAIKRLEREVAALREANENMLASLRVIVDELGVVADPYPEQLVTAYEIARAALAGAEDKPA